MKRTELYLFPGKQTPELKVLGMKTERAKEERKTLAFDRYFQMLKERKEILAKQEPPEEKTPRVLRPIMPVSNPQSPVIQNRE